MIEHYLHIRMEAKRAALDAIAQPVSDGVWHKIAHSRRLRERRLSLTD
jgi:hypothetical protein